LVTANGRPMLGGWGSNRWLGGK